ncbi:hypothetical protein [Pseudorhizobium pelagicum]|uniref:Uncharacterized protein n=1 Tax=Pseudorhizobium pelagicum TaxID=1509405 RepID=A0A922T5U0_9HYPH|nr:hypothetical protein [Pseudorhizobium pelagicum]KEQ08969.1 hypothetical protein GV67_10715 [Pseudorhizobium pelagicum]KEQ09960.1 hypothetical protein GV68_21735 [Pseudorhizobium pelagicum]
MSDSLENARKFLESLQRTDLSKLIAQSKVESRIGDSFWPEVVVRSPRPFSEALASLPQYDRKRIAEAVVSDEGGVSTPSDIIIHEIPGPPVEGLPALLPELVIQQETMIKVATGERSIQDANDYYIARQVRLTTLCGSSTIQYDNPHPDLWAWFHYYKDHFGTYAERRRYVRDLFKSAIADAAAKTLSAAPVREPTGWERVDRALTKARSQIDTSSDEEDYQAIGLLCREVMISLAQAVYDPAIHASEDGVSPSLTDANRMLEGYVGHSFPGESYKEVRAHARAALALALNLQHRRTATRKLAALCLEAATSATSIIAIISDRGR